MFALLVLAARQRPFGSAQADGVSEKIHVTGYFGFVSNY
jgi:hypothetical protein